MRRIPNPWILIPAVVAATGGAVVGYFVTDASCGTSSCPALAGTVAAISGIATAVGIGVVAVLALKSFAEWRDHADREVLTVSGDEPPGPPTC